MMQFVSEIKCAAGLHDVFNLVSQQIYFYLDAIVSSGRADSCSRFVYVSPKMTEKEFISNCDGDENTKISQIAIIIRATVSFFINVFGELYITIVPPLHFSLTRDPISFVINFQAAYFIIGINTLSERVEFWISTKRPNGSSDDIIDISHSSIDIKSGAGLFSSGNYNRFRYNILHTNEKLGIEFREYPSYNYVDFDSPQTMKMVMTDNKPLEQSHVITHSNVKVRDDKQLFQIVSIKQPIQPFEQYNEDKKNEIGDEAVVKATKRQVVAIARPSNPLFDCSYFSPIATAVDILSYAEKELRVALQSYDVATLKPEEEEKEDGDEDKAQEIVFVNCNTLSGFDLKFGEVWIYLYEKISEYKAKG
jgi:hypothetical protein